MGYPPFTFEKRVERFWRKVKIAGLDDCWLWIGTKTVLGYGQIWINGKKGLAHRFVWELTHEVIPDGAEICHRCDYPPCVNPLHLFAGTHADNMGDCRRKGRMASGQSHGMAKLTWDAVNDIRKHLELPQKHFAEKYGVDQSVISDVRNNRIWIY